MIVLYVNWLNGHCPSIDGITHIGRISHATITGSNNRGNDKRILPPVVNRDLEFYVSFSGSETHTSEILRPNSRLATTV